MASVESATALLTAVSIGIAAIAVLVNQFNWSDRVNKEGEPTLANATVNSVIITIVFGFGSTLYYLYLAEFKKPVVFFPNMISSRHIFIIASLATFFGIYMGLAGLLWIASGRD